MDQSKETLAEAIRVEYDAQTDEVCLVFLITNEKFKQKIKKDWMADQEVKIDGKYLIK